MSNHWSQFWQQGHTTTFGSQFKDNYTGPVADFWQQQFTSLPLSAKILDVGTGNGAVALLAHNYALDNKRNFNIVGIDSADISVSGLSESAKQQITFHRGVAAESMSFTGGQFQLVCSQFGIEYSDLSQSLAEVYRVLDIGGMFTAVCHSAYSQLIQNSKQELAIYQAALEKDAIFDIVHVFFTTMKKESAESELTEVKKSVNIAVNSFIQQYKNSEASRDLVASISQLIVSTKSKKIDLILCEFDKLKQEYSTAVERLSDMMDACLDRTALNDLGVLSKQLGFSQFDVNEYSPLGEKIAWVVQMTK